MNFRLSRRTLVKRKKERERDRKRKEERNCVQWKKNTYIREKLTWRRKRKSGNALELENLCASKRWRA